MNKKNSVQPLSENTRKAIIIAAIVVVAVVILSIALALILKPTPVTPDDQNSSSSGSSSLTIRNGDFEYTSSDDTSYPKTAQNWTRYGYKKASGSSHDFNAISSNDKAVMGIVNVADDEDDSTWKDVVLPDIEAENLGYTINNPGVHEGIDDGADDNKNVYMIAAKEPTAASIISDSTSVSSGASVKITIWLNTAQLADDSEAVIMIQKSTVSALSKHWYAYDFHIGKADGWQKFEFHIFNRDSSTKYIRVNIGLGNVYSGEEGLEIKDKDTPINGSGVLFIDDITYETVTANDYRTTVDAEDANESTKFKIIENEDITDESIYLGFKYDDEIKDQIKTYENSEQFGVDSPYSPFTDRDDFYKDNKDGKKDNPSGFTIYKLSHDGSSIEKPLALRLNAGNLGEYGIGVTSSLVSKDHHHLSFWVRVDQINKAAYANVYVQKAVGTDEWEDLSSGSWTLITTSQDIEEDSKCGWVKYDVYLKPSAQEEEISILFVLGKKDAYTAEDRSLGLIPNGSMYVTSPAYENISYTDYNSASSGSYVKKLDLIGSSATTTVTNGSFSTLDSTGLQPSGWTPAYGGDNSIYKDGKGNTASDLDRLASTIYGSGTVQNFAYPVKSKSGSILDDEQKNVLRIRNNEETSYGYFSSDFTLSSKSVYVISVLFKSDDDLAPHIYLLNTDSSLARSDRKIASVTTTAQATSGINAKLLGSDYDNDQLDNEWIRYYMIVVTDDESLTVRLALFNGTIEGETQKGTVYYDKVEMHTIGTYSFVEDEDDEDATLYKVEWTDHKFITATKANVAKYGKNFDELLTKTVSDTDSTLLLTSWGIGNIYQPSEEKWAEMRVIPEEEEEDTGNEGETEEKEARDVDLGLLFSVISSVALVAALLVVFVVKVYKNKGKITKTA